MITYDDFSKVDIRVGTVIQAENLADGKYSTHKLHIDFGPEIGQKKSCARLVRYKPEALIGRQVLAVVNFPPKQIGKNISEVLVLGVPDTDGNCVLIHPDSQIPPGAKLF
ncbi:MAG TPA: tRNA-binding protein [bacterium]|nr:tRNA-binding protein [bacterium]